MISDKDLIKSLSGEGVQEIGMNPTGSDFLKLRTAIFDESCKFDFCQDPDVNNLIDECIKLLENSKDSDRSQIPSQFRSFLTMSSSMNIRKIIEGRKEMSRSDSILAKEIEKLLDEINSKNDFNFLTSNC
jgi:hypothetical protein